MALKNDKDLQEAVAKTYGMSGNVSETCRQMGIGRDTFYRLRNSAPEFNAKCSAERSKYLDEMVLKFQEHGDEALNTLLEVMHSKTSAPTARVAAATRLLDYGYEWGDSVALNSQIAELQRNIEEAENERMAQ